MKNLEKKAQDKLSNLMVRRSWKFISKREIPKAQKY